MKNQLLLLVFIISLASCTSKATPNITSTSTSLVPTETLFPTVFQTAFYTPIPTDTQTPIPQPTVPLLVTESTPSLNPTVHKVFLYGITGAGDLSGTLIVENSFLPMYEPQGGYSELQFIVLLPHPLKNNLSLSQVASMTSDWRMYIYRYRTDNSYSNQPTIELNNFQAETDNDFHRLITKVEREKLQTEFGDCRAFASQIIDEHGDLLWQGYFVLNPNSGLYNLFDNNKAREAVNEGILLGYPYSFYQEETAFFRQKGFITISEPKGGFYRLTYMFNFILASGTSATVEQESIASKLAIRFFPYQQDGKYSMSDSYPVTGNAHPVSGTYTVELPIDYLKENIRGNNMYYLQIEDDNGNTIKDETFEYIPYAP